MLNYSHLLPSNKKKVIFNKIFLRSKELETWTNAVKPDLEKQITKFNSEPTQNNYSPLEKTWGVTHSSTKFALEKYLTVFDRLQKVLLQFSPPEPLKNKINQNIEERRTLAKSKLEELNQMNKLIVVELPKKLTTLEVKIPDNFLDALTSIPMEDPFASICVHLRPLFFLRLTI